MRKFFSITLLIVALSGTAPSGARSASEVFLSGVDDLPLMTGLVEDINSAIVFDSASGRYVEAFAEGLVTADAVNTFYTATLPQLGWRKTGNFTFEREDEVLMLEISQDAASAGAIQVRFVLSPKK